MNTIIKLKDRFITITQGINKERNILYTVGLIVSILFAISMFFYRFLTRQSLNKQSETLLNTSQYSLDILQEQDNIKESFPLRKQISDMLGYESQIDNNIQATLLQRERLSTPFNNLLHIFYTPSINIWKDPFSGKIDTTLIGKNYIETNPYGDITLIQQWTSFFKDVGLVDNYNTINDVRIGNIEKSNISGYFSIPITVQFETPNKRSFLLLVNKISMTAYVQNLSLMNEFMYYLRETIKEEKSDVIKDYDFGSGELLGGLQNEDKKIGYLIYDWIIRKNKNILINDTIIAKTIRKTAGCTNESQDQCLYMFREKLRALPYLAYGISRVDSSAVEGLEFFFRNIPPILSIESFSFEEKIVKKTKSGYKGTISFRIYGKDITQKEKEEISQELGKLCFISNQPLSISISKTRVEKNINELGKGNFNTKRSASLNQILLFINKIEQEYPNITNHKQVVRLFELYRTLKENSLCDIVQKEDILSSSIQDNTTTDEGIIDEIIDKKELQTVVTNNTVTSINQEPILTGNKEVTTNENRQIGDGNSKRDAQLQNELNTIEQ